MNDDEAQLVLRRAVALRLARNREGISFLRERFGAGMGKTKVEPAFRAVVGRASENVEDFNELARQAAELDTFAAFMDALNGRKSKDRGSAAQSS